MKEIMWKRIDQKPLYQFRGWLKDRPEVNFHATQSLVKRHSMWNSFHSPSEQKVKARRRAFQTSRS